MIVPAYNSRKAVYMIYPLIEGISSSWLEDMSATHGVSLVMVYVPADRWNDYLTPWPEPGEAPGCPPFGGEAANFLDVLKTQVIPASEKAIGITDIAERHLIGVSLSGLFALWQWMTDSTFSSIACLSGSFWYAGFMDWFNSQPVPAKEGKAYFLLGRQEPNAKTKAYQSVGVNTEAVVARLKAAGINVTFNWVPGDHFANPLSRAARALAALFPDAPAASL